MANRAGLKKVQKTVKGKKGTVRRTYWVKANNFVSNHKVKTAIGFAGAVAVAGFALSRHPNVKKKLSGWIRHRTDQKAYAKARGEKTSVDYTGFRFWKENQIRKERSAGENFAARQDRIFGSQPAVPKIFKDGTWFFRPPPRPLQLGRGSK